MLPPCSAAALPLDVRKVCDLPKHSLVFGGYAPATPTPGHSPYLFLSPRKVADLPHIRRHSRKLNQSHDAESTVHGDVLSTALQRPEMTEQTSKLAIRNSNFEILIHNAALPADRLSSLAAPGNNTPTT